MNRLVISNLLHRPLRSGISILAVGGTVREGLSLLEQSLQLKPDNWSAYTNVINARMMLGDERGAWRQSQEMIKAAGGRPGKAREYTYINTDYLSWNLPALLREARYNADTNGDGELSQTEFDSIGQNLPSGNNASGSSSASSLLSSASLSSLLGAQQQQGPDFASMFFQNADG